MEELTIGQRIAAKRRELGLSQIDLGEKMSVSRQSVSKWEADGAIPEIDKLIALSKLFGVSVGWLLGVEQDAQQEQTDEHEFSDREWEIIDRLTQNEPKLPKWLLPLIAGVAACSLIAAFLSGAALFSGRRRKAEFARISQSVADLTASLGAGLQDASVLEEYSFVAEPSEDLEECTFRFTGIPPFHQEGSTADLLIVQGSSIVLRQECQWRDSVYFAEFTLPTYNGYTATFCLTGDDGTVFTSRVYDHLLYNLMDQRNFGTVSGEFDGWGYDGEALTLSDMRITIEAAGVYRDTPDLWASCDLVVLGDGRELGRVDLLNRSKYSKAVNFSSPNVDFFTKAQSIPIGAVKGVTELDVMLICDLSTGLQLQKTIATFHPASWKTP